MTLGGLEVLEVGVVGLHVRDGVFGESGAKLTAFGDGGSLLKECEPRGSWPSGEVSGAERRAGVLYSGSVRPVAEGENSS